jgi:FtsP/CotA-like multicopper oxidase with cupredoxin domain
MQKVTLVTSRERSVDRMVRDMDTQPQDDLHLPLLDDPSLTRRRFLSGAAIAGGGLIAAGLAACGPVAQPGWTLGPSLPSAPPAPSGSPAASAAPSAGHSMAPSAAPSASASAGTGSIPAGWTAHDVAARDVVRRYLGNLVPALKDIYGETAFLKLADILGAGDDYPALHEKPAFVQVPQLVLNDALKPLTPELDGDVKVFKLTIDEIEQRIDEKMPPVAGLGFNGQWPGPTIRVNQGDKVRALFTNNLKETTGIHFHGVEFADFFQDGVPFVTQKPIIPGETYAYEFTAVNAGSLMYHSHHNATDQVGRGLLGAFLVDPQPDPVKYDREYVWISNDQLGGFTINGHGFPAVVPVLAAVGETVRVRFMNEGIMMHPWHLHGMPMHVVARDGWPLGSAAFDCDTLGVNPGERFDVLIEAKTPGVWAFHCHILPHVEGASGMFGMVSTLIVVPKASDVDAIVQALLA